MLEPSWMIDWLVCAVLMKNVSMIEDVIVGESSLAVTPDYRAIVVDPKSGDVRGVWNLNRNKFAVL